MPPKPVSYKGKEYGSRKELCQEYGIDEKRVTGRLCSGWTLEEAVETALGEKVTNGIQTEYGGVQYPSLSSMAERLDLPLSILQHAYYRTKDIGQSVEYAREYASRDMAVWGKEYQSLSQVAMVFGISHYHLVSQVREGVRLQEAVKKALETEPVQFQGKTYEHFGDLCAAYRIQPANVVAALLCSPVITLVACHRINRYNDMRTEKGKGSRTPVFRREPCSGTTIKTWLLYQDMKWNTRRTKIFLINSKEECICPCCGSPLKYRDSRERVHKVAGGGKEWYLIRRLRCSSDKCGKLHNELPDCICPYKHYDAGLIEDVADGVVSEVDTETEDYPCEGTMKHWRWWLWMNEKNMEGHLRLAAHRFLDLDGKFLKSRASLLEEMKKRISPGWLKAAARVIYNSGGRIEPYPSAA